MGASEFMTRGAGSNPRAAFAAAREKALYDHGHAGYSGTLAEKHGFVEIAVPDGIDPAKFAEGLLSDGDKRIDDKWGPAGCVKVAEGTYLFFGWASS
jgi:hypothetical protein